ncbi:MAG: type II toxin-antitoxin system RelE/ParE family toxin [Pontiellaceae bacterium]|nr:type II toxin-antitoxin system RelE/ParE family toxin [Pontiellaceae bacterium]
MKDLMTRRFFKWVSKQSVSKAELATALEELKDGVFEASLGGDLYKKRIRFKGRGKSGSGRTIICYKRGGRAIFIHGFAKNEKDNLSAKEQFALREFSKILTGLTDAQFEKAIANGDFKEV